jgi:hypothetical protein
MTRSEAGKLGKQVTAIIQAEQRIERRNLYQANPKRCKNCSIPLLYESKRNTFCSHSCSASFNNFGIIRNKRGVRGNCKYCSKELPTKNHVSYCTYECQWQDKIREIEAGECRSPKALRRYLLEKNGNKCSICVLTEWLYQPIPLILDHIDGHSENNFPKNIRLVCGNCDMQLPTYKGKNKGNGRHSRMIRYEKGKSY